MNGGAESGSVVGADEAVVRSETPFLIGATYDSGFDLIALIGRSGGLVGPIASYRVGEIIWLSGVPSDEDRQKIEGYLAHKWGLAGNLPSDHPYKHAAPIKQDVEFRVTFLTGTFPATISLGASYAGPADSSLALYDAGDGNWVEYTGKTITRLGDYIAFKGDWRTSGGIYAHMFNATFQSAAYTCKFSGALEHTPSTFVACYQGVFRFGTAVVAIEDNPLPILTGAPAGSMFREAFSGMSSVTSLPEGFMDTSGLTGAPANRMFYLACNGMSGVTSLPEGFMDTRGLTGAPATSMFRSACADMSSVTSLPEGFMDTRGLSGAPALRMFEQACQNMSSVTSLPEGFMDTSGLSGAPVVNMFNSACGGMSSVTNAYTFNMSSNITWTSANVGNLNTAFANMPNWGGEVMWGTNVLALTITPDSQINTFTGSTNMPNYSIIDGNWKGE